MSVQTRVMVDGHWTTRTLDIHQILARNRQEKQEGQQIPLGVKPPIKGLLTRTIVRSPVVKFIIPARVRHRSKNDVIFVYDDYIVIKEIVGGERIEDIPFSDISLNDVAAKKDFDSSIQAARVLGEPRKPKSSRFPGKYWSIPNSPQYPLEVKSEPIDEIEVPPQILVLSTSSRILIFLFAYPDVYGEVHFISTTWPLPAQVSVTEELGVHLAVDPKSRAMAVGACQNRIVIYALKTMEQIRDEVQGSAGLDATRFMPFREEKHAKVDGILLKMEFLHPSKGDENRVILLLIVAKDQKTRLVHFEWDFRSGLHGMEEKPSQMLKPPYNFPRLLIPLTYGTAFALICKQEIVVFRGILTGDATVGQPSVLEVHDTLDGSGSPGNLPAWTQWARPMRPLSNSGLVMDNIYICRADGVVRYIDIREGTKPMVSCSHRAGKLKANLDSAFATLDLGNESNDLLVAGGDMCDGGMWYFAPRQDPHLVGRIRNWTPLGDVALAAQAAAPGAQAMVTLGETERVFACSSRGTQHGAILELRLGTEATRTAPLIDLREMAQKGVVDMWALPDRSNTGIYLMIAHPTDTELILLPASNEEDPRALNDMEELDLDTRTIAAGSTADGMLIQVTPSSVKAISQEHGISPLASKFDPVIITIACFLTIPARSTILLTVTQDQDDFYLHHGHFGIRDSSIAFEELGKPILLRSEASCVSLQWMDDRIIAFVGTLAGTLQYYSAEPGSSFVPYYEYQFDSHMSICDSVAVVTCGEKANTVAGHLVVCGLRDGTVRTLLFDKDASGKLRSSVAGDSLAERAPGNPSLSLYEELSIGNTSVKVTADASRSNRAIIACEQRLYTLAYTGHPPAPDPGVINKIWMTDPVSPSFQSGPMACFTQANAKIPHGFSKFAAGSLFYLTGSTLLIADLTWSSEPDLVPRRLPLSGTPVSIGFSQRLGKLIVTYMASRSEEKGAPKGRSATPAVALIEPDSEFPRFDAAKADKLNLLDTSEVRSGETLLGAVEWLPTDGVNQYHMLLVPTRIAGKTELEATGRLLLYSLKKNDAGATRLELKRYLEREAPVWLVTTYGDSSILYGCGNDLVLQTFDMETRRFESAVKIGLRSPVSQISVHGSRLHVSTRSSGHYVFKIEGNRIVPQCAGASGRPGTRHFVLPDSIVLTTDLESRVAGIWQPSQPQLDRTAPLLFEAFLPSSIRSFCRVTPPSQQRALPGLQSEGVIGTTDDGAVYQLSVLDENSWRLLAFVQNMAMKDPRLCPYPPYLIHERPLEPSMAKKENMHINGDLLVRLLDKGAISLLEEMLSKLPNLDPEMRYTDFATPEQRRKRFNELVEVVFPETTSRDPKTLLDWIRALLLPAL
ncbi:MAG: hypothetical protein Q9174_004602 [Haloplaca sp. 1 TL-2023]